MLILRSRRYLDTYKQLSLYNKKIAENLSAEIKFA